MNALHSPDQDIQHLAINVLGKNIRHTVGENRVEVFFFLQLQILTSEAVADFLSNGTTNSLVMVAEVLAETNLKHIHKCILALVGDANKELKVIRRMSSVIENENILNLLAEPPPRF